MSLNGLDDAPVLEAYQAALAEAGGWFLLRYASRDGVTLYRRGHGGFAECRGAVNEYDETSPLFGLLLYRRRKVLLKYIPDGTSRLLKVRVTVHFQAIAEKFSPHDAILEFTSPTSLAESELTSACALHTATSPSSSNAPSVKKQKLDEITEDAEESASPRQSVAHPTTAASAPAPVVALGPSSKEDNWKGLHEAARPSIDQVANGFGGSAAVGSTMPNSEVASDEKSVRSSFLTSSNDPAAATDSLLESESEQLPPLPTNFNSVPSSYTRPSVDSLRPSFQSARPSISDLYSSYDYSFLKPKVKLGPRPRASLDKGGRPSTADAMRSDRPVASLPAGLRIAPRTSYQRPKSRDASLNPRKSSAPSPFIVPPPPPIPDIPDVVVRPASVKSLPATISNPRNSLTPEKIRLMKALELRKKQMKAAEMAAQQRAIAQAAADEANQKSDIESPPQPQIEDQETPRPAVQESPRDPQSQAHGTSELVAQASLPEPKVVEQHARQSDINSTSDEVSPTSPAPRAGVLQPPAIPPKSQLRISADHTKSDSAVDVASESMDQNDGLVNELEQETITHSPISSVQESEAQEQSSTRPTSMSDTCSRKDSAREPDETTESKRDTIRARIVSSEQESDGGDDSSATPTMASPQTVDGQEQQAEPEASLSARPTNGVVAEAKSHDVVPEVRKDETDSAKPEFGKSETAAIASGLGLVIQTDIKSKRRHIADSSRRIDASTEESDADGDFMTDDDSFLEELQSATVQEAKPVSMVQSPTGEYFPSFVPRHSPHEVVLLNVSRSASGTLSPRNYSPPWGSPPGTKSRSGSEGVHTPPGSSSSPGLGAAEAVVTAKRNVSSGISQRIKLLTESTQNPTSPNGSPESGPSRSSHLRPAVPKPTSTMRAMKRWSKSSISSFQSGAAESATPSNPPKPLNTVKAVWNMTAPTDVPQSVSVTAHIVREGQMKPDLAMPTDGGALELHRSPLVIEQHKENIPSPISTLSPSAMIVETAITGQPSPSSRRSSEQTRSWHSKGARSPGPTSPRSVSNASVTSSADDENNPKSPSSTSSRSAKFFRRMSSGLSSVGRKGISSLKSPSTQSLVKDDSSNSLGSNLESVTETNGAKTSQAKIIGDLNVQFPDTLLWKRRWTEVDPNGNLVFGLEGKTEMEKKGLLKRFHLSEFKPPVVPDLEMMEMPHSVVLNFLDGRTLQCACWDQAGQKKLLQVLRESHQAWSS